MTPLPCDLIVDACDARGWTFAELVTRSGLTRQTLRMVCSNRASIDAAVADGLATAFGGTAQYWLDAQDAWDNREGE